MTKLKDMAIETDNQIRADDDTKGVVERNNKTIPKRSSNSSRLDKKNDEEEDSSDEGGKCSGSGSGSGGYNADNSSSDSSSSNNDSSNNDAIALPPALPSHPPQSEMQDLTMYDCASGGGDNARIQGGEDDSDNYAEKQSATARGGITNIIKNGERDTTSRNNNISIPEKNFFDDTTNNRTNRPRYRDTHNSIASSSSSRTPVLPQWNGVKVQHPMDPRIDLSIVGVMRESSQLYSLQSNFNLNSSNTSANIHTGVNQNFPPNNDGNEASSPSFSGVEQYTNLLESVRPFFSSHDITCTQDSEPKPFTSTEHIPEPSRQIYNAEDLDVNAEVAIAVAVNVPAICTEPRLNRNDDDSSMVVLARSKRKHLKQQNEDAIRNGSSLSESNSDKEERAKHQQHPQLQQQVSVRIEDNIHRNASTNESSGSDQAETQQQQQFQDNNHQEGNSRIEIPTMVSEYSSSARNDGSEIGNNNILSTSGSGSGGNTGSGTGSGSNQGGSSGSGNDQGWTSSNGNGSAGSSNKVGKGSSEELMDNNEEHNNRENREQRNPFKNSGTSDSNVSDTIKAIPTILVKTDSLNIDNLPQPHLNQLESEYHHHQYLSSQHRLSNKSRDNEDKNATREKKLQDKKRKRMNMRREYEDKMEQEMESSESSDGREVIIHPGKPITLDKAVSFTKTAKLVIKPSLPFTVIYTNAAYSRLSGIDSHNAVGKPISALISLPSAQLSLLDFQEEHKTLNPKGVNEQELGGDDSEKHVAAEAAGRARAAASKNDIIKIDFENLVVSSGHNKLNEVSIRCNSHQVLERIVKVVKPEKNEEDRSNGKSSITSNSDLPYNMIECTMSISPVLSSTDAYTDYHHKAKRNEKDQDSQQQKAKRRKHRQIISHYMIQLDLSDGNIMKNAPEKESRSNLSTKGSLRQHNGNETKMVSGIQNHTENEVESFESSSNYKHLSATA